MPARNHKNLCISAEIHEQIHQLAVAEDRTHAMIVARAVALYAEQAQESR